MRNKHRTWFWCFIAVVVIVGTGLLGCVENRGSVTILRNAVPNSDCTIDSASNEFRSMGVLDLSETAFALGAPQYVMFPVLQSNLISTKDQGTGSELNIVEILEARVDVDTGNAGAGLEPYSYAFPTFVTLMPGDSAALPVVVIPPQYAAVLATRVQGNLEYQPIIRVRVKFLYQLGGREIETHQIEFPVILCDGCLIRVGGYCDSGLYSTVQNQGNPCSFAQDSAMDCCLDNGGGFICPAVDTSSGE